MRLGLCHSLQQVALCDVCDEPLESPARFTAAWGTSADALIEAGVCPLCRSMPEASGRDSRVLRERWERHEKPATRPGVGLPFDLI
jgi:hypothetical protein